jgi:hypothetical protein
MSKYIFLTDEGVTIAPNDEVVDHVQVLGYADGKDEHEAEENLLKDNPRIKSSGFTSWWGEKMAISREKTPVKVSFLEPGMIVKFDDQDSFKVDNQRLVAFEVTLNIRGETCFYGIVDDKGQHYFKPKSLAAEMFSIPDWKKRKYTVLGKYHDVYSPKKGCMKVSRPAAGDKDRGRE